MERDNKRKRQGESPSEFENLINLESGRSLDITVNGVTVTFTEYDLKTDEKTLNNTDLPLKKRKLNLVASEIDASCNRPSSSTPNSQSSQTHTDGTSSDKTESKGLVNSTEFPHSILVVSSETNTTSQSSMCDEDCSTCDFESSQTFTVGKPFDKTESNGKNKSTDLPRSLVTSDIDRSSTFSTRPKPNSVSLPSNTNETSSQNTWFSSLETSSQQTECSNETSSQNSWFCLLEACSEITESNGKVTKGIQSTYTISSTSQYASLQGYTIGTSSEKTERNDNENATVSSSESYTSDSDSSMADSESSQTYTDGTTLEKTDCNGKKKYTGLPRSLITNEFESNVTSSTSKCIHVEIYTVGTSSDKTESKVKEENTDLPHSLVSNEKDVQDTSERSTSDSESSQSDTDDSSSEKTDFSV